MMHSSMQSECIWSRKMCPKAAASPAGGLAAVGPTTAGLAAAGAAAGGPAAGGLAAAWLATAWLAAAWATTALHGVGGLRVCLGLLEGVLDGV